MEYLTPAERLQEKEKIIAHYAHMQSWAIREGKALKWLKDISRDAHILECGCGSGYFAMELLKAGFVNVYETDNDEFIIFDEVRSSGNFLKADLSFDRLPFEEGSFDLIIALQVLEHVENPWHATREFFRVLKKGGLCIISIPRADALSYRWSYLIRKTPDIFHMPTNNDVNFFIPDLLHRLFNPQKWQLEWTDYSTSFIRITKRIKIRFPDWKCINKIFARRIAFCFKKL